MPNHLLPSNRLFMRPKQLFLILLSGLCAASAPALQLTWDPLQNGSGTASDGNWDTTATNTVWRNGTSDVAWTQINATTGTNSAIFNGPDGTWFVTNDLAGICPSNMYINASGYSFYGSTLRMENTSSAMYVAPGKTVSFYCQVGNANNGQFYILGDGS